jgi:hypothetical protein
MSTRHPAACDRCKIAAPFGCKGWRVIRLSEQHDSGRFTLDADLCEDCAQLVLYAIYPIEEPAR